MDAICKGSLALGTGCGQCAACLAEREDDPSDVHVTPTYGREHLTTIRCWCCPSRDTVEPLVVVHRDPN